MSKLCIHIYKLKRCISNKTSKFKIKQTKTKTKIPNNALKSQPKNKKKEIINKLTYSL